LKRGKGLGRRALGKGRKENDQERQKVGQIGRSFVVYDPAKAKQGKKG